MAKIRDAKTGRFKSQDGDGRLQAVVNRLASNATFSRAQLVQSLLDPRRNIDDECGYPSTENITRDDYRTLYDREPVAARVVEVLPHESWQMQPTVFETEDVKQDTELEKAWSKLGRSLRGESWYQDEEGNPIWEELRRIDVQSGIGSFGVLLLGLDDGLELSEPAAGVEEQNSAATVVERDGKGKVAKVEVAEVTGNYELTVNQNEISGRRLLFLRSFDESLITISRYEGNSTSPRFGQPLEYSITFNDPNSTLWTETTQPLATKRVHWTRVIHVADNLGSSEIFGVPRMRPVYNRLFDLRKLYSGSAEMYWKGALPGWALETDPRLGVDAAVEPDAEAIKEHMERYMTGLQRYLLAAGVTVKSLAPQVVDPTPQIEVQIEAICIQKGIPKRIFVGSERGELASSQDKRTWNGRLHDRQINYITPRIIVPFIDRLIMVGVLPKPTGYSVAWPDLNTLTEEEQAAVGLKRTESMAKYVQGSVESLMAPMDYLVRVLGMTEEEAEAVVRQALAELPEVDEDEDEDEDEQVVDQPVAEDEDEE